MNLSDILSHLKITNNPSKEKYEKFLIFCFLENQQREKARKNKIKFKSQSSLEFIIKMIENF
jgi:hypothetical protein